MIKLSPRLAAVARLAGSGGSVIDVGTDHGYVPVYLAENRLFERIAASDIGKKPLNSAISSAQEHGMDEKIEFYLSDGLRDVPGEFETVTIAGMGGETMVSILDACPWADTAKLVLQPQSKFGQLLAWLESRGFVCEGARLVEDAGRIYAVFRAGSGEGRFDLLETLASGRDPLLGRCLCRERARLTRALSGMERGGRRDSGEYGRLSRELYIVDKTYTEVLKW